MAIMVTPGATGQSAVKRKVSSAGLTSTGRTVKRRASKACQCCRARKVRCDVVESGSPCTNCRLDEVECIVSDSKRRKKPRADGQPNQSPISSAEEMEDLSEFPSYEDADGMHEMYGLHETPSTLDNFLEVAHPNFPGTLDLDLDHHVPHMLYQTQGHRLSREERKYRMSINQPSTAAAPSPTQLGLNPPLTYSPPRLTRWGNSLPRFIRPLPPRIMADDIEYLEKKGALTTPEPRLRNELLRSYVQYVHPYMPLLELTDLLQSIERDDGTDVISLLLFQAVMFAATAFIDVRYLHSQGFESRKAARKAFFQRARLLYDFDYEQDRISLVQALLLMTYWYETPDDQKDTWHWMGVSLSLAHTIGLHRNPEHSNMDLPRQRLWKRIWWSCFMRDRLIALGMRRPTRIKNDDCDVPMLVLDDFETESLAPEILRMLGGCAVLEDSARRRQLAEMCIEKAKLCLCISHVLAAQYSVLSHKFGGTTETTMMLLPKKSTSETCEVMRCDQELDQWYDGVPEEAHYRTPTSEERRQGNGADVVAVHRALLRMIYLTTSSALHRPQVLPSTPSVAVPSDLQELSRRKVRVAASEITGIAQDLHNLDLVRFLPTSGVTVLLPAVIIHLLDIKSSERIIRNTSLRQFSQCMQVLQRLREMYASADFATSFLEAAIRKANIQMPPESPAAKSMGAGWTPSAMIDPIRQYDVMTPPPDAYALRFLSHSTLAPGESSIFSSLTPPDSDSHTSIDAGVPSANMADFVSFGNEVELARNDFDALLNFDSGADLFAAEDGLGVDLDVDWMAGMPGDVATAGCVGIDAGRAITGDLATDLGIEDED